MTAEITELKKENNQVVESNKFQIVPKDDLGYEYGLRYFFEPLNIEEHVGLLIVNPRGTGIMIFTRNWPEDVVVLDRDIEGQMVRIDIQERREIAEVVNLKVIETEFWRDDIGIRIKHIETEDMT